MFFIYGNLHFFHTNAHPCSTLDIFKAAVDLTANCTFYESYDLENKYMINIYNQIASLHKLAKAC